AGSASRFTVVGGALHLGPRAQDEGRAVVPGVPVLLAQPLHHRPGVPFLGDPHQGAQEATALDLELGLGVAGDGQVVRHRALSWRRAARAGPAGSARRPACRPPAPTARRPAAAPRPRPWPARWTRWSAAAATCA